jgi:hypothetical protein
MRRFIFAVLVFWLSSAHALVMSVAITPADGFVRVGQEVTMVMNVANDSSEPRPGFTSISAAIDGLSSPFAIPPCQLRVSVVSPTPSPIYYFLNWDLIDLQPNETRQCEARFNVLSIPNGSIPIQFRNNGVTLTSVVFRSMPTVSVPSTTFFALIFMASIFSFTALRSLRGARGMPCGERLR